MGIVDDLLANPGLYIGKDHVARSDLVGAARIRVSVLPGRAGVSLDYELLNGLAPGPVLGHVEHTLIGRADDGATVMVIAHTHGEGIAFLRESEPGVFEPGGFRTGIWEELQADVDARSGSPFDASYRRTLSLTKLASPIMGDPGHCARVIADAVEARTPRARYLVGYDAQALALVQQVTPTFVKDRVLRLFLGL